MVGRRTLIARKLRGQATDAERRLWGCLRGHRVLGSKFRQQEPVAGYFADFLCEDARLIVELDGGQHGPEVDAARTRELEVAGYLVIRFWNHDVLSNTEGVIAEIERTLRIARCW